MTPGLAAISERVPELAFAGVTVVALLGVWLLASNSARRSTLLRRGGMAMRRRRRPDELLDPLLSRTERGRVLDGRLRSAGTSLSAGQFLLVTAAVAVVAYLITRALFAPLIGIAGGLVGGWACFAWLDSRLEKRKERFVAQLPDVARLLSSGASAGLSVPMAMEIAVRELEMPAREELQRVLDEVALGRSLDDALDDLHRRLPSREISVLLTTIVIQQRSGGDVVHALRELSETLETRRNTLREMRTLMAGAVYTSYLVPAMGLGTLVLLNAINSHTLDRMTHSAIGLTVLVVAGSLYAVGTVIIRRITRVEL